jgi:uncharacterized Rmd1/YagE family protein
MSTFIKLGLDSLQKRFCEIDTILEEASKYFEVQNDLYSSLCRSAQVLLSAHFEGYLKDLVKNSLEDINHFSSFKNSNKALKRRHCEFFLMPRRDEKNGKAIHQKIESLISEFDDLDTKFKKEYFSYSDNKNPKATVLDKIAEQYGIKNFFKKLKQSNLDNIFSNTKSENIELRNSIRNTLLVNTGDYPYSINLDFLEIDATKDSTDNLWDAFLSELLKRRHDIAHGRETENISDYSEIESDKVKLEILIYTFTAFVCMNTNPIATINE